MEKYNIDFLTKDELTHLNELGLTDRQIKIIDVMCEWRASYEYKSGKHIGFTPIVTDNIVEGVGGVDRRTIERDLAIMKHRKYILNTKVRFRDATHPVNAYKLECLENIEMSHNNNNNNNNNINNDINNNIEEKYEINKKNEYNINTEEKNNIDIYGYCLKQLYLYEGFTESRDFNQFKKDISQYGIKEFIENLETSTMTYDNIEKLQDIIKTSKEEYNLNMALNNN